MPIDSVAGDWKKNLPPEIDKIMHADGHYVAAPFSVHRVNWLCINKAALDKAGGKVPTTWPEFFAVADKMKAAGITPVAQGGQPWQDLTLWEDVVLSQGADFYKKALVDLDQKTLTSDQMVEVFDTVRKIQAYFDSRPHGPRLEPRHRDGHQRQGRHAVHGRLGEGRIRQRRQEVRLGLRLRGRAGHGKGLTRSTSTRSCSSSRRARRPRRRASWRSRRPSCRRSSRSSSA